MKDWLMTFAKDSLNLKQSEVLLIIKLEKFALGMLGYYLRQAFRDILSPSVVKIHELQMVNAYSKYFIFIYYLPHL